jgi:hypothetical protein
VLAPACADTPYWHLPGRQQRPSLGGCPPTAHTQHVPQCRAPTQDGTPCRNRVSKAGQRCYKHRGLLLRPTAPAQRRSTRPVKVRSFSQAAPRQARPSTNRAARQEAQRRDRVTKAAEFCADALGSGWQEAVADRAAGYVSDTTWDRLFRAHRRKHCRALARIARRLLDRKQQVHRLLGGLAARALSRLGADDAAQAFTDELVASISLPLDAKIIAVARGFQVTGILLCVVNGDDLTQCQCFIDLALTETKTQVRKILVVAIDDWAQLREFQPRPRQPAA